MHFRAQTQYGDWSGSAQADEGDLTSIRDLLQEQGLVRDGEFLVGFTMFSGENLRGQPVEPVSVRAYLIRAADHGEAVRYLESADPVRVRKVFVELTLEEFFGRFKRFSLALSWTSLNFHGREVIEAEE